VTPWGRVLCIVHIEAVVARRRRWSTETGAGSECFGRASSSRVNNARLWAFGQWLVPEIVATKGFTSVLMVPPIGSERAQ
jgi:hypothetical protein